MQVAAELTMRRRHLFLPFAEFAEMFAERRILLGRTRADVGFRSRFSFRQPANVPQPEANAIENTRKAREGLLVNFRLSGFRSYCPA